MAAGKGIQIVVGTDYNDRDLKRAQRDLDRLKGQAAKTAGPMAKLGNTIRSNVGPAMAMAAASASSATSQITPHSFACCALSLSPVMAKASARGMPKRSTNNQLLPASGMRPILLKA